MARPGPLLFGIFGGFVAWILHLGGSYLLVPWVCDGERVWVLHGVTGGLALVAAASTAAAWQVWREARGAGAPTREQAALETAALEKATPVAPAPGEGGRRPAPGASEDPTAPLRAFLGLFGVLLSGFFLFLIVVEGLPALLLASPCQVIPTLDDPIVQSPAGRASLALAGGAAFLPGLLLALPHPEGGPVGPGEFWTAWSPDPWILAGLALAAGLYLTGVRRLWRHAGAGRGLPRWRVAAYLAGIWFLVLALVSPLDALAETLFSAHMVQHMVLMVVAAPLLVLGHPILAWLWALPAAPRQALASAWRRAPALRRGGAALRHPLTVLGLHGAALWMWHIPTLYQAALLNPRIHLLEHATYLGTALLFWWALAGMGAQLRRPRYGAAMLYVFAAALQSGALGALLLFASTPWFPAHAAGVERWGLDLLVDQQIAAALMWVPAGLVYTGAILLLFVGWMKEARRSVDRRERRGWHLPMVEEGGRPG